MKKVYFYYYDVNLGNNGILIKRLLDSRSWWRDKKSIKSFSPEANFVWAIGIGWFNYDKLTIENKEHPDKYICINRFQNGYEINDKDNLFRNLWHNHKPDVKKMLTYVPITFSFRTEEEDYRRDLQEFCRFFLSEERKVPLDQVKPIRTETDSQGKEYNVYYEFQNHYTYGTEKKTFKNFKAEEVPRDPCLFNGKNIWMLKPGGLNRGKGLELFTKLDELNGFLYLFSAGYDVVEYANMDYGDDDEIAPSLKALKNKNKPKKNPLVYRDTDFNTQIRCFVIQKYIEKPLVHYERKFDLRVFVLLTQERDLYVFSDAYVRLSSLPYDPDKKNYLIHLTNNAVQVRSDSYGSVVKGNIVSILDLEDTILRDQEKPGYKRPKIEKGYLMQRIKDITALTMDSTYEIMEDPKRSFNFELFGYDFMIDEEMKVWLIECNSVPALGESNDYITKFMTRSLDDMLKLTIDKIFPKPEDYIRTPNTVYDLPNYPSHENLWSFVKSYDASKTTSPQPAAPAA